MRKFILTAIVIALMTGLSLPVKAELTQQTVDSMFVIASSGAMKYRDMVQPTITDMAGHGIEIVPFLIDKLGTIDARERSTLEQIFRKIETPAVPLLNDALLTVEDSLQLSRVALILHYIPDSSSVENLLKVKDHSYYWVRYETIRALGKIGDRRGLDAIKSALQDENELVRTMAAVAVGRMVKDEELFEILVPVLDDKYYGVRFSAYEALLNLDCEVKADILQRYGSEVQTSLALKYLYSVMNNDTCQYDYSEKINQWSSEIKTDEVLQAFGVFYLYNTPPMTIFDNPWSSVAVSWDAYYFYRYMLSKYNKKNEKEEAATDSR
ncbi:MAG: HEAT repeat domain-containing protein [Candidatus Zixiibacteriota bacterium]